MLSLPSRERGLKFPLICSNMILDTVAPFAGAWIEIEVQRKNAGLIVSLPSRERGLK